MIIHIRATLAVKYKIVQRVYKKLYLIESWRKVISISHWE